MAVINDRLVPVLETMAEDLENATDRNSTLCAALATVLHKIFNTKDPKAQAIIDSAKEAMLDAGSWFVSGSPASAVEIWIGDTGNIHGRRGAWFGTSIMSR